MNKKTVILLIFLFLLSLAVGTLLGGSNNKKPPMPAVVVVTPTPEPAVSFGTLLFPNPLTDKKIQYSVPTAPSFPTKIDIYRALPQTFSEQSMNQISKALNFSVAPQKALGTRGTVYIWSTKNSNLTIGSNPPEISFVSNTSALGQFPESLESLGAVANNYINSFVPAPFPISRTIINSRRFQSKAGAKTGPGETPGASIVQFEFSASIEGLPIYVGQFAAPAAWVRIDASTKPVAFFAYALPSFIKETSQTIISSEEATSRLVSNRGILVNVAADESTDKQYFLQEPPGAATITKVELAYYFSPENQILNPVYVFRGKGTAQGTAVKTTTIVSAFP
jgi:hypothetical protein